MINFLIGFGIGTYFGKAIIANVVAGVKFIFSDKTSKAYQALEFVTKLFKK